MKTLTRVLFIMFFLSAISYPLNANAAVPHLINYQGRLTDKDSKPLEGVHSIIFSLYNTSTSGSAPLWTETQSVTMQKGGAFNVLLGSVKNLDLAFDVPYWLGIKVDSDSEMTPKQQITSAGYAIKAEKAEQAGNADTVANVGVSATPAANKILPLDNNAKLSRSALKVYDSGWFAVSQSTTYTKTHGLGTTCLLATVWFSPNADGSNAMQIIGCIDADVNNNHHNRGAQLNSLTATQVTLLFGNEAMYLMATSQNAQIYYTSGYARIILLAF